MGKPGQAHLGKVVGEKEGSGRLINSPPRVIRVGMGREMETAINMKD